MFSMAIISTLTCILINVSHCRCSKLRYVFYRMCKELRALCFFFFLIQTVQLIKHLSDISEITPHLHFSEKNA